MTRSDRPGRAGARVALAALLAAACSSSDLPAPHPTAVEPGLVIAASGSQITLRGERFYLDGDQSLGDGGSSVTATFRAWVGGPAEAQLTDVEWVDEGTLRARVPPGLAPGRYDVWVENAFGRGVAPRAVTLLEGAPAAVDLAATLPGAVAVGQEVTLTLDVENVGGGALQDATPVLLGADPARLAAVAATAEPRDLAPGARATFQWTLRGVTAGEVELSIVLTGTDVRTGGPFASEPFGAAVTVLQPAQLTAAATLDRAEVPVGGKVVARVQVANAGPSAVRQVAVVAGPPAFLSAGPAPAPFDLAPGATATMDVPLTATQAGTGAVGFDVTGVDVGLGLPVAPAHAVTPAVTALASASLAASLAVAPLQVGTGQDVAATLTVENRGGTAADVTPVLELGGTGALEPAGAAPAAARIAPGASRTFAWALRAVTPGDVTLAARAEGVDAVFGSAVVARATAGPVTVQSPAQVVATARMVPEAASVHQQVELRVAVTNVGGAPADVGATLQVSGAAALTIVAAPPAAPVRVHGGETATLRWTLSPGAVGEGTATATLVATDVNTGAKHSTTAAATVSVDAGARLEATLSATPDPLNDGGHQATVRMRVRNAGGATALDVAPSALALSGAGSVRLVSGPVPIAVAGGSPASAVPPGGETWFEWRYAGEAPGAVAWTGGATGKDGNGGWTVTAPPATADVRVQRRAVLAAEPVDAPARVNVGQEFPVRVRVANGGEALARAVEAAISVSPAVASAGVPPAAADVAGGGATELVRWFTGAARGSATVAAELTGEDATDGRALSATAAGAPIVVERPAQLTGTLKLPSAIAEGDLGITLTVKNAGDAAAEDVRAGALEVLSGSTASVDVVAAPAAGKTLAGGDAARFAWKLRVRAAGTLRIAVTASGTDANEHVARSVRVESPVVPAARDGVRVIAADPLEDGSPFAFVAGAGGAPWVGPSRDGTRLARVPVDGAAPVVTSLAFARDTTGNVAASAATPYASIGFTGCTPDSLVNACGPDGEDGRGLLTSASFGGEEWLVLGGARSGGDLDYVYLAGGDLSSPAFRYVDLSAFLGGNTRGFTAARSVGDRLYLGFSDNGGSRPFGVALVAPPTAPGLDAVASADALGLQLHDAFRSALGAFGAIAMVDGFAELGGRVYAFSDVGCIVSTTAAPQGRDDFAGCSPAPSAAYDQADSVGVPQQFDLEPADRAWPQAAEWKGRLYAIRNTWSGPQLWACDPAGGADPAVCDPEDWGLVAADADLRTRLGHPGASSASLLVATPGHLYLGLDDPDGGVHLYRTAADRPSTPGEFEGAGGCAAGTPGCEGLGGDGLGDPTTLVRVFDAKAIAAPDGTTDLYLTAGDGAAPVRVIRIGD